MTTDLGPDRATSKKKISSLYKRKHNIFPGVKQFFGCQCLGVAPNTVRPPFLKYFSTFCILYSFSVCDGKRC